MNTAEPSEGLLALVRQVLRLGRALYAELDEPLTARLGLNIKELVVLAAIAAGETSPGRIAALHHLPAATVTRLLHRLAELGFVERVSDPADLRRFRLELTAKGREAKERRNRESAALVEERYSYLRPETVRAALAALNSLETELQEEKLTHA